MQRCISITILLFLFIISACGASRKMKDEMQAEEAEEAIVESLVLKTTKCYNGPEQLITQTIRKEKQGNEPVKFYLYDCANSASSCSKSFEIITNEVTINGLTQNCLLHPMDLNVFQVCATDEIIYDGETNSWTNIILVGSRNGTPIRMECDSNYPQHSVRNHP